MNSYTRMRTRMPQRRRFRVGALVVALAITMAPALTMGRAEAAGSVSMAQRAGIISVPGCSAFLGARKLGARIRTGNETVYACGPRPNYARGLDAVINVLAIVFPYTRSIARYLGYQCVELTSRYLAAAYGVFTGPGVVNGAQEVDNYKARYPRKFRKFRNGNKSHPPKRGDVISFSSNRHFNDVGHTGVVLRSKIDRRGHGRIRVLEQNFGGATGADGYHVYKVRHFKVISTTLPHVKWLHRRGR